MSWKFKVSKYKNAAPRYPKREESIYDVPVGSVLQTCGNHIAAGCTYMAFNITAGGGGNLGILPLEAKGRIEQSLPTLKAHADYVTDIAFSPFDDQLLATCSADATIKLWLLPEKETLSEHINTLAFTCKLPDQEGRVENVAWNTIAEGILAASIKLWSLPEKETLSEHINTLAFTCKLPDQEGCVENVAWNTIAEGILAASVQKSLKVFDVQTASEKYDMSGHGEQIQSVCWNYNGNLLSTTCKDKKMRVLDPRSNSVVQECTAHDNNRDSRAVWLQDMIITTGFTSSRQRELALWDSRNLSSRLTHLTTDTSTGVVMPLLDVDTSMLLLVGKGDSCWSYYEVGTKDPYFTQNSVERMERSEQIKGACLVPKRALNVMEGEVDRLLVMGPNSIQPLPYIVPRKQYKDFHDDLFPDTRCNEAALSAKDWFEGQDGQVKLMSLNPAHRGSQQQQTVKRRTPKGDSNVQKASTEQTKQPSSSSSSSETPTQQSSSSSSTPSNVQVSNPQANLRSSTGNRSSAAELPPSKPVEPREPSKASKAFGALHQSKCKYLKGTTAHPSTHIVNIRKLCRTLPGQSNLFDGNTERCALPIEGSGGLIAILQLNKPGRLPDTGVPVVQNGAKVNDFAFDPFDHTRLLVGCENAKVFIWKLPEGELTETLTDYDMYLMSHTEKIYFIRFNPVAKDVVVTGAYDMALKFWDLNSQTEELEIRCHTDEIFCAEWSPDGKLLATVCKDGKVRIFDPRKSEEPVKEGVGPEGTRGARVVWAVNMKYLIVSGFRKDSGRIISVYSTESLGEPLHYVDLDVCPAILIPWYDEASSTVFLTGRGDGSILTFEVSDDYPHLFPLTPIKPEGPHQGIYLLPKTTCDVRKVEIARLMRLTQNSVEPISVTVPRVKTEYFQDDLFPDIYKPAVPTMTSNEWFRGSDKVPEKISLRPSDMKPLSEAPVEAPKARKYDSYDPDTYKTDEMKKEELINAVTTKLGVRETPLPQDTAEGVDSDEWDDY